jgi:hypothetical protein
MPATAVRVDAGRNRSELTTRRGFWHHFIPSLDDLAISATTTLRAGPGGPAPVRLGHRPGSARTSHRGCHPAAVHPRTAWPFRSRPRSSPARNWPPQWPFVHLRGKPVRRKQPKHRELRDCMEILADLGRPGAPNRTRHGQSNAPSAGTRAAPPALLRWLIRHDAGDTDVVIMSRSGSSAPAGYGSRVR